MDLMVDFHIWGMPSSSKKTCMACQGCVCRWKSALIATCTRHRMAVSMHSWGTAAPPNSMLGLAGIRYGSGLPKAPQCSSSDPFSGFCGVFNTESPVRWMPLYEEPYLMLRRGPSWSAALVITSNGGVRRLPAWAARRTMPSAMTSRSRIRPAR